MTPSGSDNCSATASPPIELLPDALEPTHYRLILDFAEREGDAALAYQLVARDARDLPGKSSQAALVDGRRVGVVEESRENAPERLLTHPHPKIGERHHQVRLQIAGDHGG